MLRRHTSASVIAAALSLLTFAGCDNGIRGSHVDLIRYDPKSDSFATLHSWTNIACRNERELEHLQFLWDRRESIIVYPLVALWSRPAIVRRGNHEFRWIDLKEQHTTTFEEVSDVDLNAIGIIPGEFYLNRHGNLSYFHQAVIPGKTIDAILTAFIPRLVEMAEKYSKEQSENLRNPKFTRLSWDEVRQIVLREIEGMVNSDDNSQSHCNSNDVLPLDDDSLGRLRNAGSANSVNLFRKGDDFSLVLPLSLADCRECADLFALARNTLVQYAADGKQKAEVLLKYLDAMSIQDIQDAGLEISMNLTKFEKLANLPEAQIGGEPDPGWEMQYLSTIRSIERLGIPVRRKLSFDDVDEKYIENN